MIADGLDVEVSTFGIGVAIIRLAGLGAIPVLRLADRFGRRRLLLLSVLGFTIATGATAAVIGLVRFVAFQMIARVFLTAEESLAGVVIGEELGAERRGRGLSMLGILSQLGFGAVAAMLLVEPLTSLGWRIFYLFALLPLGLVIYLRRNLRETAAFSAAADADRLQVRFWPAVDPSLRPALTRILVVIGLLGLVLTSVFFFAAELAQDDYGWTGLFTAVIVGAGICSLGGYVVGGHGSDHWGRKRVTALTIVAASLGAVLIFSEVRLLFAPGFFLVAASFASLQTVGFVYLVELFPTELRATLTSVAWTSQIVSGSIGLILFGLGSSVVDVSLLLVAGAFVLLLSLLALRGLPETATRPVLD